MNNISSPFVLFCGWSFVLRYHTPVLEYIVRKVPKLEILSPVFTIFSYYQVQKYLSHLPFLVNNMFVRSLLQGYSSFVTWNFYFSVSAILLGYPTFRYFKYLLKQLAPSDSNVSLISSITEQATNAINMWNLNVSSNKTCDIRFYYGDYAYSLYNRSTVPHLLTSKEIEDKWPHRVARNDEHANKLCGICGVELGVKVWIREMGCGCSFHQACIDRYLKHVDGIVCGVCSKPFNELLNNQEN